MKGRSRTIVFILLFAFSHSWTKSSKKATVLVLRNSFPMFPCIASAAMNVWPFFRYLIVIVSGPHVFTHCARPGNKYHFCSDRYSYLSIARCDLHYTDEFIAGTLTQHQVLYGQQLLHARECSSLVYQESMTRMSH